MSIHADDAAAAPLRSDQQIEDRVRALVGRAIKRQWWMLFLDGEDRQLDTLVPIEGYPLEPDEAAVASFTALASMLMEEYDAKQVIFVWERRADKIVSPCDAAWARAMADACRDRRIFVRAQLISHRNGVRWLAVDDYAKELLVT